MNKEELIAFINSLELTEVSGFNLIYYNEEKNKYDNFDKRELRSVNYNFDIKRELENIRRNMDCSYENMIRAMEEKLKERGVE